MNLLFKTLLLLCLCSAVQAEVAVPPLKARVTDLTGTFSEDRRALLEKELQALEAHNGTQIAVLLVPTTQPETIEQYSMRVVEAWKLGQKKLDNGLLLLVAKDDHKLRIEVGYGLEGVITDVVAHRIIDETITPLFKEGDYEQGIQAGVFRLEALIETEAKLSAAQPKVPGALEIPHLDSYFFDLTNTVPQDQADALRQMLADYEAQRRMGIYVLAVPTAHPETLQQLTQRAFSTWEIKDGLEVKNSVLIVLSRDEKSAEIVAGSNLNSVVTAVAAQDIARALKGLLEKGELMASVQSGVQQVQALLVNAKLPLNERIVATLTDFPIWLIVTLIAIGTALRWFMGPLLGGLTMGGAVGGGAWLLFDSLDVAIFAGVAAFVFVLVGLMNWIAFALSASSGSGSSSGGGFSGGGGSFGGGGASGSW